VNKKARAGFMLLEAILTVVIASICLTFIAQSLLTNFRAGMRFQEAIRSFVVMENRLGLLYATDASEDQLDSSPQPLDMPYDKFTVSARTDTINDHLKNVGLILNWPVAQAQGHLDVTTIIYNPDETKSIS
jgi:type II secretory pathway pseudopilin PulG